MTKRLKKRDVSVPFCNVVGHEGVILNLQTEVVSCWGGIPLVQGGIPRYINHCITCNCCESEKR